MFKFRERMHRSVVMMSVPRRRNAHEIRKSRFGVGLHGARNDATHFTFAIALHGVRFAAASLTVAKEAHVEAVQRRLYKFRNLEKYIVLCSRARERLVEFPFVHLDDFSVFLALDLCGDPILFHHDGGVELAFEL